jgi:hypothetical protein
MLSLRQGENPSRRHDPLPPLPPPPSSLAAARGTARQSLVNAGGGGDLSRPLVFSMERGRGAGAGNLGGAAHRRGATRGCSRRVAAASPTVHGGWRLDPRAAVLVWWRRPGLPCDGGSSPAAPLTASSLCGGGRLCRRRACGTVVIRLRPRVSGGNPRSFGSVDGGTSCHIPVEASSWRSCHS